MKLLASLLLAAPLIAHAHKNPKTPQEIEVQRNLQAAAYHCAPAVQQFTAARKRSWAQKVLGGRPSLASYEDLFDATTYSDLDSSSPQHTISSGESHSADGTPSKDAVGKMLLSCIDAKDSYEAEILNNTCVLAPEVTEGPYYHPVAHPIRQNIAEFQFGLLTLFDIGVIDVETCEPLPNVLVDIWHANATGHYAGHPDPLPKLVSEVPAMEGNRRGLLTAFPRTIAEETWLRGAWPTNSRGVAQFSSIFPGYYTGRALHVHTKVFTEWTPLPNGTFQGGKLAHTGQFFFDDMLVDTVSKMWPYATNPIKDTWGRTRNWADSLNIFNESMGPEAEYDPVFRAEKLGEVVNQGLVSFITMGVNRSASYDNFWKG